ncbi:hypothetical protein MNBD_GAMMA11-3190, partial [hydrothermal vent metagenome]
LTFLLAPVQRVCGYDTIMPLYRLEEYYMPSAEQIVDGAVNAMEYT